MDTNLQKGKEDVVLSAWLTRQFSNGNTLRTWKKRFFKLTNVDLKYFQTAVCEGAPLLRILLSDIEDVQMSEKSHGRENLFRVVTASRVILIGCDSEAERDLWIGKMRSVSKLTHVWNCKKAVYTLLMIGKYAKEDNVLVFDLWKMIAKILHRTRRDDVWG